MFAVLLFVALALFQTPSAPQPESAPLEGTWRVDIIDNIKVMPEAPVTLAFRGSRITGSASCNSFQGNVTVAGTTVKFESILATLKACDDARMSQERDFFAFLRRVSRYELGRDGALSLLTVEGKRLSATKK